MVLYTLPAVDSAIIIVAHILIYSPFPNLVTVVARSKAINYLRLVAAIVERHDRNSGRRPVESSLFPFIFQATSGI